MADTHLGKRVEKTQPITYWRYQFLFGIFLFFFLCIFLGVLLFIRGMFLPVVSTFSECQKAKGSITQESYPATCVTRDGKRFEQQL